MKLRLGDTVIELENIAYARKMRNDRVHIYFVGREAPLKVNCGKDAVGTARTNELADTLMLRIEKHETGEIFKDSMEGRSDTPDEASE